MEKRFLDRAEAGRELAARLGAYKDRRDVIVLALPRGGVPVGYEVARTLDLPLDVFVVRKLGVPANEELAMGALASGGVRILDDHVLRIYHVTPADVERVTGWEQAELERREQLYRGDRSFPDLTGKTVILVDDGLATGSTMRAGIAALRQEHPSRIIVAVPVAAKETCDAVRELADDVVCARMPEPFYAVGMWYDDFSQTTDEEVHDLIERAAGERARTSPTLHHSHEQPHRSEHA